MRKTLTTLMLALFCINISAQQKTIVTEIDSLREQYTINKKQRQKEQKSYEEYIKKHGSVSSPPLSHQKKHFADYSCKKTYNIPVDEFIKLYPFDADSIEVAIPDSCFWRHPITKKIGILSTKQIGELTDILYNYDYKKMYGIHISTSSICGCGAKIPSIRFVFHHGEEINYVDIFYHGEPLKFFDTFEGNNPYKQEDTSIFFDNRSDAAMYWGGECDDTYAKIHQFIEKHFRYSIQWGLYEETACPDRIELIELKEHKVVE